MFRHGLRTVAALALCGLAAAQNQTAPPPAHPDFSGDWQTNVAKSDFGKAPVTALTWKIEHQEPQVKISLTYMAGDGEQRMVANTYSSDGKETANTNGGVTSKSVAKWDGPALTIETKVETAGAPTKVKERWTMSEDRKVLTMAREMFTPQGDWTQKVVYDRVKWGPEPIQFTPK